MTHVNKILCFRFLKLFLLELDVVVSVWMMDLQLWRQLWAAYVSSAKPCPSMPYRCWQNHSGFDVIICDIHIPVVNGEQVARMIRSTNNHNQLTPSELLIPAFACNSANQNFLSHRLNILWAIHQWRGNLILWSFGQTCHEGGPPKMPCEARVCNQCRCHWCGVNADISSCCSILKWYFPQPKRYLRRRYYAQDDFPFT